MKHNRYGQATPVTPQIYAKIRAAYSEPHHRLCWDIAYYTGERWGAIVQLQLSDVYDRSGKARAEITFRRQTRKDKQSRTVPAHPLLVERLGLYDLPDGDWLFPGDGDAQPFALVRGFDAALRRAIDRAGLSGLGLSTHSTRRGFITALHSKGVSVKTIQSLTGHRSLSCLSRYIEVSDRQKVEAIALI